MRTLKSQGFRQVAREVADFYGDDVNTVIEFRGLTIGRSRAAVVKALIEWFVANEDFQEAIFSSMTKKK